MRVGKTYLLLKEIVPFIFKENKVDWLILTAPFNFIINPGIMPLKEGQGDGKYIYENDIRNIEKLLSKDKKVVSYFTNKTAFSDVNTTKILSKIDLSRVSIVVDEADYGSVSGSTNMWSVKAYDSPSYKATMYKFISKIAKYSPYTYALTATPNYEIKGALSTVGDLNYKIYAEMKEGEQIKYAHYVAWANNANFYSPSEKPLLGKSNETVETIGKVITSMVEIEELTNLKRSAMFMVQDSDEKLHDEKVIEILTSTDISKPLLKFVSNIEYVGAVLTHGNFYLFNLLGETKKINKKDVETLIVDAIDNQNNPLRILLVKQMAGRGVTFKTVKELMLLRTSNPKSNLGPITETTEQGIGRAKTIYPGRVSIDDLHNKYDGDIRNVPKDLFTNKLINSYNVYLPNNEKNIAAWKKHKQYDACTFDMLGWDMEDICCSCGQKLPNRMIDDNFSGIDAALVA